MKPLDICNYLGPARIDEYYGELSGKEIRTVLKAGGSPSNTPATAYTQVARRKIWRKRFDTELAKGNGQMALALLLEWLLRYHRSMLATYLDALGVAHKDGETEEDFCETRTPEQLRAAIPQLMAKYPEHHVASYLLLVGHLQDTPVFDRTPELLAALGLSGEAIQDYIREHERAWKPNPNRQSASPRRATGGVAQAT